jgi:hypothetical protein
MSEETLFRCLEKLQGPRPWGAFLDAGTGRNSLAWVASLPTERWTAVTVDRALARELEAEPRRRSQDRVLCANWLEPSFLHGERFETVLADYLLGAVDRYAPYFQEELFGRLRPLVARRLYVIGMAPFDERDSGSGARLIVEIAKLRDACILLAQDRCYREYPLDWTLKALERAGFSIEEAHVFPIIFGEPFINGQLDVCLRKLPYLSDRRVAAELERHIGELRERGLALARASRGIRFGEDYVIAARPRA